MLQVAGSSGMPMVIFKLFSVSHTHSAGNQLACLTAYFCYALTSLVQQLHPVCPLINEGG
jgi:hypothetical protein